MRHQAPIEWIAMVMWKSRHCGSMFQSEWQRLESAVQRRRSRLSGICLQLAELRLDRYFPHAHRADEDLISLIRNQHIGAWC